MSNNISNNHPIINNSNQYFYETRYFSFHSEDRDVTKFPRSSEFEITLPQDYLNVVSARLSSWAFPANYSVFTVFANNVLLSFKFIELYNPGEHNVDSPLLEGIFAALYSVLGKEFYIEIEPGFYNTIQMPKELTNKLNQAVTNFIYDFLNDPANSQYSEAKELFVSYDRFQVVYNEVSQNIWFGNKADRFVLTNDSKEVYKKEFLDSRCVRKGILPESSNWGLPSFLGFVRCPAYSYSGSNLLVKEINSETGVFSNYNPNIASFGNTKVPRFYYGSAVPGQEDNGYWLLPGAPGATVYFLQAPFKINFMGPAYFYMEIDGLNCIDETSPWNISEYTLHNNQTNGIVNSSFAKIAVPATPVSQWFDGNMGPYKFWNPPAERISKLKVKLRYHNGQLVDFGQFDYSFTIEFNLLNPQQQRSYSIRDAYSLAQNQGFGSKYL